MKPALCHVSFNMARPPANGGGNGGYTSRSEKPGLSGRHHGAQTTQTLDSSSDYPPGHLPFRPIATTCPNHPALTLDSLQHARLPASHTAPANPVTDQIVSPKKTRWSLHPRTSDGDYF